MKHKLNWAALVLGVLVVAVTAAAHSFRLPLLVAAEEAVFDLYQQQSPRAFDPDGPVRVIDIDERALAELGQWPWPRSYLAEMVDRLTQAGAAAIGFDILFAEPDRTSPQAIRRAWARFNPGFDPALPDADLAQLPDHDTLLAAAMARSPVVLGTILVGNENAARPQVKAGMPVRGSDPGPSLLRFRGANVGLPQLSDAAMGVGSVSLSPSNAEVVRRVPLLATLDGVKIPALSIELLRVAQGAGGYLLRSTDADPENISAEVHVESLRVGELVVPLDADGGLRVRYSGDTPQRVISAADILGGDGIAPGLADQIAGRILLVGTSAPGLRDLVSTPLTAALPGVVVHAEIVEQIVAQTFLTRPDWAYGLELVVMVLLGLVVTLILAFNLPKLALGLTVLLIPCLGAGSWLVFQNYDTLLSALSPALSVGASYLALSAYNYFTAEASRREITRQFQHFVSPEVIDDIIANPDLLAPGGARRELSVLFLDVRRFSTLTEKMQPEEVITFINKLLTPLTDVILEHEGTVDKYMGDAIMAFWNAPRTTENHEIKAVTAMQAFFPAIDKVNEDFAAIGLPAVDIGVGINTGPCSVGNMGSTRRLSYSCVGDAVNLASRLEGQTKQYGVRTLIGSATAAAVTGFALVEIDRVAVKGRSQAETIFTVAGGQEVADSLPFAELTRRLTLARDAYLACDWDVAERAFARVAALGPVGTFDPRPLCAIFAERIADYRLNPPGAEWDGSYVATSK